MISEKRTQCLLVTPDMQVPVGSDVEQMMARQPYREVGNNGLVAQVRCDTSRRECLTGSNECGMLLGVGDATRDSLAWV